MISQYTQSVKDLLSSVQSVAIVLGQNPSYDATAAALSLYLSLLQDNKSVRVISPSLPTVGFSDLVGIDKIKNEAPSGFGNGLVISLPYQQGAIEKISYDIIGERINLTVVPGPQGLNFTTDDIVYQSPNTKVQLIITVGIANENEIAPLLEENKEAQIINIDNAVQNSGFGTIPVVDATYSSLSELVTMMLTDLALPFDIDIAQNLLLGVTDATNNFQSERTSSFAFEAAGLLLQKGARRAMQSTTTQSYRPEPVVSQPTQPTNGMQPRPQPQQQPRPVQPPMQQPQQQVAQQKDRVDELREALSHLSNKPQQSAQPMQQQNQNRPKDNKQKAPKDWFEPKIYKSSTQV